MSHTCRAEAYCTLKNESACGENGCVFSLRVGGDKGTAKGESLKVDNWIIDNWIKTRTGLRAQGDLRLTFAYSQRIGKGLEEGGGSRYRYKACESDKKASDTDTDTSVLNPTRRPQPTNLRVW